MLFFFFFVNYSVPFPVMSDKNDKDGKSELFMHSLNVFNYSIIAVDSLNQKFVRLVK